MRAAVVGAVVVLALLAAERWAASPATDPPARPGSASLGSAGRAAAVVYSGPVVLLPWPATGSGARVRALVTAPQPLDRDVRVDLGRRQAGVAQHLLDAAQVGTALEQVRRRAVPQAVRPDVGCARYGRRPPV